MVPSPAPSEQPMEIDGRVDDETVRIEKTTRKRSSESKLKAKFSQTACIDMYPMAHLVEAATGLSTVNARLTGELEVLPVAYQRLLDNAKPETVPEGPVWEWLALENARLLLSYNS